MARQFYSRRHYERLSNGGPDTPEQVRWRMVDNEARGLAQEDTEREYPVAAIVADISLFPKSREYFEQRRQHYHQVLTEKGEDNA